MIATLVISSLSVEEKKVEDISTEELKSVLVKAKALLEKEEEIEKAGRIAAATAAAAAAAQTAVIAEGMVLFYSLSLLHLCCRHCEVVRLPVILHSCCGRVQSSRCHYPYPCSCRCCSATGARTSDPGSQK